MHSVDPFPFCFLNTHAHTHTHTHARAQAVRGLVSQLVRTMASERKQLMQRVRHLQAGGGGATGLLPPSHTPPAPFLAYAPGSRRSLANSLSAYGSGAGGGGGGGVHLNPAAAPGARGGGGAAAAAAGGGARASFAASLAAVPGVSPSHASRSYGSGAAGGGSHVGGMPDAEQVGTPKALGLRRSGGAAGAAVTPTSSGLRSSVRRSTDTDVMLLGGGGGMAAGGGGGHTADGALPALSGGGMAAECLLPPLPNPYSGGPGGSQGGGGGAPLHAPDMDELMDVLQVGPGLPYSTAPLLRLVSYPPMAVMDNWNLRHSHLTIAVCHMGTATTSLSPSS